MKNTNFRDGNKFEIYTASKDIANMMMMLMMPPPPLMMVMMVEVMAVMMMTMMKMMTTKGINYDDDCSEGKGSKERGLKYQIRINYTCILI